jgi:aldose 1-epimerase
LVRELTLPEIVSLRCGELQLDLAPAVGGSIAALYSERSGRRHDWLRPASRQALLARDPEAMASFPLIPFCNRIRHGRFHFQGRDVVLPLNRSPAPHAIHGVAWDLPWKVLACDDRSAQLRLDYLGGDWPYCFCATQFFQLFEDRLTVTMEVHNRDSVVMPIGLGHHPYVPHLPDTRLTVATSAMWLSDAELMPTELGRPPLLDLLRTGVNLGQVVRDNNFIGWDGLARVDFGGTRSLILRAQSPLDFFVLYSPEGQDYFCIEPVSNCTDWLNLCNPPGQIGGALLASGDTYRASFELATRWA